MCSSWFARSDQFIPASLSVQAALAQKASALLCPPAWRRQLRMELHDVLLHDGLNAALALPGPTARKLG
jgi:hypothetical protein